LAVVPLHPACACDGCSGSLLHNRREMDARFPLLRRWARRGRHRGAAPLPIKEQPPATGATRERRARALFGRARAVDFEASAWRRRSALGAVRPTDLRSPWPVILLRELPAKPGSLRRFQADSGAGSARDEEEAGGRHVKDIYDLQGLYGSDGTRTRDLRRDRPAF
jgi:hypothetical protein